MWMAAVTQEGDFSTFTDPCRQRRAVTDLPVEAAWCHPDSRCDCLIPPFYQFPDIIHISRLKPTLLDVFGIFVGDDPVKLLAVSQGILNEVHVFADPDIDAVLLQEWLTLRNVFENITLEEGAVARIAGALGGVAEAEDELSGSRLDAVGPDDQVRVEGPTVLQRDAGGVFVEGDDFMAHVDGHAQFLDALDEATVIVASMADISGHILHDQYFDPKKKKKRKYGANHSPSTAGWPISYRRSTDGYAYQGSCSRWR